MCILLFLLSQLSHSSMRFGLIKTNIGLNFFPLIKCIYTISLGKTKTKLEKDQLSLKHKHLECHGTSLEELPKTEYAYKGVRSNDVDTQFHQPHTRTKQQQHFHVRVIFLKKPLIFLKERLNVLCSFSIMTSISLEVV